MVQRVDGGRVDIGAFEVQEQGFGDAAPPLGPDVAGLVAGRLAPPGVVWQQLTQVGITTARHQTADGRPAVRPQTAVTDMSRPLISGSDGGQTSAEELGEAWLAGLPRGCMVGYDEDSVSLSGDQPWR